MSREVCLKQQFEKIFLDHAALNTRIGQRALEFFGQERVTMVSESPLPERGQMSAREYDRSKRWLYITNFKGQFFKKCPGAKPGLTCCNYFVLNLGLQCNMNCSYCYLQSYLNTPITTIYANGHDALNELKIMADAYPDRYYRVGTGEVMDSLSLDDLTLYSRELISFFSQYPKWTLELKSKSSKVDQFLNVPHAGNVITSWSVNPEFIVNTEEHGTAYLHERLAAARKCRDQGFKITFHIDPMIWHPEWKKNYGELVDIIASQFKPDEVPYVTVGALRFVPEQKNIMRERFEDSWVLKGETFLSSTGKLRYDSRVRSEMFQFVIDRFKSHSPHWRTSLCMETPENWVTTMASSPTQIPELQELFVPPQRGGLVLSASR